MTSYEKPSDSSDSSQHKCCEVEEMHIHCMWCETFVSEDDIHPDCNYCESCRTVKENGEEVYCCSNSCEGIDKIWYEGELTCDWNSRDHFRIASCDITGLHCHCSIRSCDVTEQHSHCDVRACDKIVESKECNLCEDCRKEEEKREHYCVDCGTSYDWSGGRYGCYCDH